MAATSSTPDSAITYAVADGIATVSLNRPEARNSYTPAMADELEHAFMAADADPSVSVVVFTSVGPDFSVGADLSSGGFELSINDDPGQGWQEPAGRCSKTIFGMNKPVIAAPAWGGGGRRFDHHALVRLPTGLTRLAFRLPIQPPRSLPRGRFRLVPAAACGHPTGHRLDADRASFWCPGSSRRLTCHVLAHAG